MKRRILFASGLLGYIILLFLLLQFDPAKMLQPMQLAAVVSGMAMFTLFQLRKGTAWIKALSLAKWNAFTAGLLVSLLKLLSLFASGAADLRLLLTGIVPLIYGSIIYVVMDIILVFTAGESGKDDSPERDVFCASVAIPIFMAHGFSGRECHVALKLLEGRANKEIASQLYISESTVKKHIQNMFKKCGAADRQGFIKLYLSWARNGAKDMR